MGHEEIAREKEKLEGKKGEREVKRERDRERDYTYRLKETRDMSITFNE